MNEQTSITQDLESLFKKTTEANKIFFSESAKFVKNISASNVKGEDIFSAQKQLFKDALNLFVKLNIQHTSNLIDLGVAITKKMNQQANTNDNDTSRDDETTGETKPAFVLNVSAAAGTTATTQFLLDSDKKDPVICNLKQTDYEFQNDPSQKVSFETTFIPQSFQLNFGQPHKVEIKLEIPADTKEGIYLGNIQVDGFEHTYFSLFINVTPFRDTKLESFNPDATSKTRKRKSK